MIAFKKQDLEVVGDPFGTVFPPLPPPAGTGFDAREHALRALQRFISCLAFERRMPAGETSKRFQVPLDQIHIYQPDDIKDVGFPFAMGIRPSRGEHTNVDLGPPDVIEETKDVFGEGTILIERSTYNEQIALEVLGSKQAHRVAMVNGLEEALTMWENGILILRLSEYYDQLATFSLVASEYIDDDPVFKNRRRADLYVDMEVPEVSLVRYKPFRPESVIAVGPEVVVDDPIELDP